MSEIVWEDPPPTVKRGNKDKVWEPLLRPLMKRRGKWARIREYPKAVQASRAATLINNPARNQHYRFPPGQWEACSRTVKGRGVLYARYLGPEKKGRGK